MGCGSHKYHLNLFSDADKSKILISILMIATSTCMSTHDIFWNQYSDPCKLTSDSEFCSALSGTQPTEPLSCDHCGSACLCSEQSVVCMVWEHYLFRYNVWSVFQQFEQKSSKTSVALKLNLVPTQNSFVQVGSELTSKPLLVAFELIMKNNELSYLPRFIVFFSFCHIHLQPE